MKHKPSNQAREITYKCLKNEKTTKTKAYLKAQSVKSEQTTHTRQYLLEFKFKFIC